MARFNKFIFAVSLLLLCWYFMMAVHEFGHVVGAWLTGGKVLLVELHPLTISRTDVFPNPRPGVVVWLGPILGCVIPVGIWAVISKCSQDKWIGCSMAMFFAGFCLVSNGAYIGAGALTGVGDCGVMLENGSPLSILLMFGLVAFSSGLYFWHCLGSAQEFFKDALVIDPFVSYLLLSLLLIGISYSMAVLVI